MSTLQETLKHHRVGESPLVSGCHTAEAAVPALLIYATDDEQWVLPWSHFVCARHRDDGKGERLVLLFANYEIELLGTCLTALMPEIARFQVDSLRSLPGKYELQRADVGPFVKSLSVKRVENDSRIESAPLATNRSDTSKD